MSSGEIDLGVYFRIIKKRLWLVVMCVCIGTFLAASYSNLNYTPVYQASTKLLVNMTVEDGQLGKEQMDFGAIGTNIFLINTYKEIIKTPVIMDKVAQQLPELNLSADQLIRMVNVASLNETQIMAITVIDFSYERAVLIANTVSEVFKSEVPKILKVDNVNILSKAAMKDNPPPINEKTNTYIILGFMASLIFSIGAILLLDSMDDTLKSDDDIQQILGTTTLSVIPKIKRKQLQKDTKKLPRRQMGEGSYAVVEK